MKTIMNLFIMVVLSTFILTGCEPRVKEVLISPDTVSGTRGKTYSFSANVVGSNKPSQNVKWNVSGGIELTAISNEGILTIWRSETADTLIVTATSSIDTEKSGKAYVTVQNAIKYGPGGGIVFYDKGEYTNGWRYIESAPIETEVTVKWGLWGIDCPGTSEKIGTGRNNTDAIIKILNANGETSKAAQLCSKLSINGQTDWFLPSKDELYEMYKFNKGTGNVGKFMPSYYWSSSVSDDNEDHLLNLQYATWFLDFAQGWQMPTTPDAEFDRDCEFVVRAVRYF